ncbi:hypothetical protein GCM10022220_50950 [Actinocatenispora rupis]|uniref:histidine kinase n=1 Tax=Actinocatenispora rupis TaxID=519421 RepID=A0A8J3JC67_9ACTN|nr:hypothetical protein Aru02nite_47160 [Actinocatenispora rupis]
MSSTVGTGIVWFVAFVSPLLLFEVLHGGDPVGPPFGLPLLVLLVPLVVVRRRPVMSLVLMNVGLLVVATQFRSPFTPWFVSDIRDIQVLLADALISVLAAIRPRRTSVPAAAATLATQLVLLFAFPYRRVETQALVMVLVAASAWAIGSMVRQRRQYVAVQREQAEVQAVQAERLRIARELHDMIAHSIGVIAIQAGVGRRVIDTQPAEARKSLAAIEDTSRDTLAGLRRMLVTLRGADSGAGSAPLDPTPGLADLDTLVERCAHAGVRVTVRRTGETAPLPAEIDLSAYRIVQEALTNVIRHARAARCTVTIDQRDTVLALDVSDDGIGPGVSDPGYGIIGMRERVGLLHGTFSAAARPEGGFRVAATLPLPAVAA